MRVVFMGTPDFSVPALQAIVDAGHEVVAAYCQPPRPAGRGKKHRPSAVERAARDLGIEVRCPLNFKTDEPCAAFEALDADIAVVVAYGLILPQRILDAPKRGCLNIHASLLPRWRGAAPIHRAIMAGDSETGVCIMQMDAGLDTGDVLLRQACEITAQDTTAILHDRLSQMGAELIVTALGSIDDLEAQAQSQEGVSYAHKISKDEARINWSEPAAEIDRKIRGLSPFPGAWFDHDGERIKVLMSEACDGQGPPGEVLDSPLVVACGTGAVRLTRLQRAGKSAMAAEDFLRGLALGQGTRLGL